MLRILWNEEETAILVCYFMKFHNGLMTRKEAVKNASVDLRKRAVRISWRLMTLSEMKMEFLCRCLK